MTFVGPKAERGFATDYEQLRSGVLDGAPPAGHFGLTILIREGVAAWIAHASARPATVVRAVSSDQPSVAELIGGDVHANMVVVLASMVMTTHRERCA